MALLLGIDFGRMNRSNARVRCIGIYWGDGITLITCTMAKRWNIHPCHSYGTDHIYMPLHTHRRRDTKQESRILWQWIWGISCRTSQLKKSFGKWWGIWESIQNHKSTPRNKTSWFMLCLRMVLRNKPFGSCIIEKLETGWFKSKEPEWNIPHY